MITCIVIDDDKNITKVFSEFLELIGMDVLAQGHTGDDAVSLYIKHRPEIIFTDIMMPDTDGFYGIEKIREFDPDAKIVAVTADISSETEQRLNKMNITAVIYKPFNRDEIKRVLMEEYKIHTR
ncbi:MAG TPA: response regulator [Nitrosarchaeum sp.]|nr:response regulator [Nitrosarchaeum sp.]